MRWGTYNWILGRDGTFPAEPLALGDVRNSITIYHLVLDSVRSALHKGWLRTLVNCQIASVTKHNRIRVLSFGVITDSTSGVFGRKGHVWFRNLLGLCRTRLSNGIKM